jgi:hypothetical protein
LAANLNQLTRLANEGERVVMKSLAWFKRMNAKGNDILVQTDEGHSLVLLGGLTKERLGLMKREGFEPSVSVQMLPGLFQAWVQLANRPVADRSLRFATTGLPQRFATTTGYLAGFTVHRPSSLAGAPAPFALAHGARHGHAQRGAEYLNQVGVVLEQARQRSQRSGRERGRSR